MDREKLLAWMRNDYRNKDLKALKRHYLLGAWMLTAEDKQKIEQAMKALEDKPVHPLLAEAQRVLGGKML